MLFTASSEASRQIEQAANDYADALERSNGVIDESIRKIAEKNLADQGALEAGRQLGVNLADLTDAALGNADAQARVNAQLAESKQRAVESAQGNMNAGDAMSDWQGKADKLTGAIGDQNARLSEGEQKQKDLAAASAQNTSVMSSQAIVAADLANRYGMTVEGYTAASDAAQKQADKASLATQKMQLENDAAGLLKQSLDALAGKSLNAAQAQNGFDRAIVTLTKSTRDAKGHIDKAKTALSGMSDAAVTNRGNLLGLATQANSVAEAVANQTGSTEAGRQKLIAMRDQIIKTAVAQGMNKDAVQKFIDTILRVPKYVPPTKLEADTKAAESKVHTLDSDIRQTMRDRRANLFINVASNVASAVAGISSALGSIGASAVHRAGGGPIPGYAGGGKLRGPGTGTSDSIVAVVRQTGRPVALSTGEYVSTAASTARNEAALAAGNRGATLGVVGEQQGDVELSERSLQRLAAILQGVPLEVSMSTSRLDRALVGG
jgi:hypothetical protein